MISLETFNRTQLQALISSDRFLDFPFLPITVHRAVSHSNNPNLEDDKATLILALEDNKLAGYIGILGDCIIRNNQKYAVGWLSTLFVHPDFRGKKIAQQLLNRACDVYEGKILITEFTPEAESMYVKSNLFSYQKPLEGMSYHFFSRLEKILPVKNQKWNHYIGALRFVDFVINAVMKLVYKFKKFPTKDFEIKKNIDAEIEDFIKKNKRQNSFIRGYSEIDWIMQFPWILNSDRNTEKRDYQFSDFDEKFEYVFIKIYKDKILNTLLMLSVRNSNAKLLFVMGESTPKLSSQILFQFAIKLTITNLICFDDEINKYFSKMTILYSKQRVRKFLMHNNLIEILGKDFIFDVSAGDGDAIFT